MTRELITNPCQGKCSWSPSEEWLEGHRVFTCAGCGSEWTTAQPWTPRDHDGRVSPEVEAARAAG